MADVVLKDISKSYDGKVNVVDCVNFEVKDKEFVVLVGPSGCGKSTTLRMIAGLEEISNGELEIDGKMINEVPPKDRDIAMVFQNYALYPHMTVFENMAFGLKIRKFSKDEIKQRVNEASNILGLDDLLQRKPKQLSGGQRQRVALGRAIVRKPKVFLFDEPLSNLDAKLRVQMRTEISKLHKKLEATMIYVTHDQTEAMTMGDRIVVMKDGLLNQIDSPINLYNKPVNKFVAGFIGSPSMNFIEGTFSDHPDNKFVSINGELTIQNDNMDSKELDSFVGKTIVAGIRPEDIYIQQSDLINPTSIKVKLDLVEQMGNEALAYFQIEGNQFIARFPASFSAALDSDILIYLDVSKIHYFDKTSGQNIQIMNDGKIEPKL